MVRRTSHQPYPPGRGSLQRRAIRAVKWCVRGWAILGQVVPWTVEGCPALGHVARFLIRRPSEDPTWGPHANVELRVERAAGVLSDPVPPVLSV